MAAVPLTNAAWGFESNCFVCEPKNTRGLGLCFFHDDGAGLVFAEVDLGAEFSGAPSYVHGGVTMAVLDEAMAWAAIALGGRFAVTRETRTVFDHPVRVGRRYRVEARLTGQEEGRIDAEAMVLDAHGRTCAVANATLVPLSPVTAVDALGAVVAGDDRSYIEQRSTPAADQP